MITCFITYKINPQKTAEFEMFAKEWIRLVNQSGGTHHGYFLPAEGADDVAYALFSFESLAAYEEYRKLFATDEFKRASDYKYETGCVVRHDRTFMRPLFA
jgi:NIPSNAP